MAAIDITPALKFMVDKRGSDLFFSTGAAIRIEMLERIWSIVGYSLEFVVR